MYKKQQDGMRGGNGPMNGGNNMSILNTNGPQQFDPTMLNQVWLFEFKLLTPNKEVFSSPAISVLLPGENGEFGVLNNHSNLISTLIFGLVKINRPIVDSIDN